MSGDNLSLVLRAKQDLKLEYRDKPKPGRGEVLIAVHSVGICGSDVHYWHDGFIGDFVVRQPMLLGHESSGTVIELGDDVKHLKVGDRVAIEPGVPCHECRYCKHGRYNLCPDITFLATPPVDGDLCRYHVHAAAFCYKLPDNVSFEEGALIEPLSVAVHACRRGNINVGQKILICGAGPLGLMCMLAARTCGAGDITVTDVLSHRLEIAKQMGATHVINVSGLDAKTAAARIHDILGDEPDSTMECSGAEISIQMGMYATRRGGTMVLVGMSPPSVQLPLVIATMKEIDIHGIFRYANCYQTAIGLVASGAISVKSMVTHRFKLEEGQKAFEMVRTKRDNPIKVIIQCQKDA